MARKSDRDDPLAAVRRLLRNLRTLRSFGTRRREALLGAVEIALFRLPPRQREIVRRYDLAGESATAIARALSVSPRQLFRDRRRALAFLSQHLLDEESAASKGRVTIDVSSPFAAGGEAVLAGKAFARGLAQTGNAQCLDALRELARDAGDPLHRADLLLELAETANDYSDEPTATAAVDAASRVLDNDAFAPAIGDWLEGRVARARAHLARTPHDGALHLQRAGALLRRSLTSEPGLLEPRCSLADTLGDEALLQFRLGNFAQARAASTEAIELVDAFGLANRPESLEINAVHLTIEAIVSGRTRAAVSEVELLLRHASQSGWSSTASRLGQVLVGLSAVSGEYREAIRHYCAMAPLALRGARPGDRAGLTMEAAHAYTMAGRPNDALALVGYERFAEGYPRAVAPSRHATAAAALNTLGDNVAALREARAALAGYGVQGTERGLGDAHRLMATSYAKLGNPGSAREHLAEARRLAEHHGTPYGLLLTLSAEAAIFRGPALEREAAEYAKLLRELARS